MGGYGSLLSLYLYTPLLVWSSIAKSCIEIESNCRCEELSNKIMGGYITLWMNYALPSAAGLHIQLNKKQWKSHTYAILLVLNKAICPAFVEIIPILSHQMRDNALQLHSWRSLIQQADKMALFSYV